MSKHTAQKLSAKSKIFQGELNEKQMFKKWRPNFYFLTKNQVSFARGWLVIVGRSGLNTMTHHYLLSLLFLLVPRIIIFGIKSRA